MTGTQAESLTREWYHVPLSYGIKKNHQLISENLCG